MMRNSSIMDALREVAVEHGIDEMEMLDRLEDALVKPYQRLLGLVNNCRVIIDKDSGAIYVYELIPLNEDELDENPDAEPIYEERDVTPKNMSRFAATEAAKVLQALIKEAKVQRIIDEYKNRIGECVNGEVLQSKRGKFASIKLAPEVEAILPEKQQLPNERYFHGDRVKVLITDVEETSKGDGYQITVSRRAPALVSCLFEIEVPEVADGHVVIKNIVRDPGVRTKVAVASNEADIDPVGACVGPKGSRVRQVVTDLKGERIDIIPWSSDPSQYVAKALSPAKVDRVFVDHATNTATVIVPNDQLSLAIGKEGQNARLAAQLTGWRIDIKSSDMATGQGLIDSMPIMEDLEQVDTRCVAMIDGLRCRNHARPGSQYCGVHDPESADENA